MSKPSRLPARSAITFVGLVTSLLIASGCSGATDTARPGATSSVAPTSSSSAASPSASTQATPSPDPSTTPSSESTPISGCPTPPARTPRPARTPTGTLSSSAEGTIALLGPTLVATGLENQVLIVDVTNNGDTEAIWRVDLEMSVIDADSVLVKVPAMKTSRVEIPIDVTGVATAKATASLHSSAGLISESKLDINAVSLDDSCGR